MLQEGGMYAYLTISHALRERLQELYQKIINDGSDDLGPIDQL